MNEREQPTLVIIDGGIPGLVALWASGVVAGRGAPSGETASSSLAWMPPDGLPARTSRENAARRQAQITGMGALVTTQAMACDPGALSGVRRDDADRINAGLWQTALLVSACAQAAALGIGRVLWPIHHGPPIATGAGDAGDLSGLVNAEPGEIDLGWLSATTDRALLAGQIASIDLARVVATPGDQARAGRAMVHVETPYADFTDAELLELALDMDVPLAAAWWCERDAPQACAECASCRRWRTALAIVDPQCLLEAQRMFGGAGAAR